MRIVKAEFEVMSPIDGVKMLKHIERCGRICYKSEGDITEDSYMKFIRNIIDRGHESVLEHAGLSVRFIVDRGVSHEIVRHRMASYSQESTRYCNYSKGKFGEEITVIEPCFFEKGSGRYKSWENSCLEAEKHYFAMLYMGASAQEARAVLPNSLKTELIMTTNFREWRHFFKLRTAAGAHPQMREIAVPLLAHLCREIPVIFDNIIEE